MLNGIKEKEYRFQPHQDAHNAVVPVIPDLGTVSKASEAYATLLGTATMEVND